MLPKDYREGYEFGDSLFPEIVEALNNADDPVIWWKAFFTTLFAGMGATVGVPNALSVIPLMHALVPSLLEIAREVGEENRATDNKGNLQ